MPITPTQSQKQPASGGRNFLWSSLGIAALVVAADQASKLWIRSHLSPSESLPPEGFFRLTYIQNTGSAFGLFANQTLLLTIIGIVAVAALLTFIRHQPLRNIWGSLAVSLLLGGSAGNLLDRLRLGYVTDFIDIGLENGFRFFVFNVADSAITVGTFLLAFTLLRLGRQAPPTTPPEGK
ncbi:MAG: signal peptidase II [Chloroflexota bacterium]